MSKKDQVDKDGLRRELGLTSVVFFIFGYVVGAGILIQSGAAAGMVGPGLWLAFIIAGIPNVIIAIIICYIVSALPVSGGAWVYSSRLGTPIIGFLVLISMILNVMGSLALLSVGFGTYFESFVPGSMIIASVIILLLFYVINVFGIKITGTLQVILAIFGDFLVIFIFIIFGLPNVEHSNLNPPEGMFPTGLIGIFMGAIILSFSYQGFPSIIEIGGEVKNPRKNIPLGLIIAFILITVVYILVSIILTGVMNWKTLGAIEGTLIDVGALFFPNWFLLFLNILILIAIASTLHGVLLAYSRDLYSAARDKAIPSVFAKLNKNQIPHYSVTFFVIGSLILIFFQASIVDLSILLSFTGSIIGLVLVYIPITLKKRFPELEKKAYFSLKRRTVTILVSISVIYSIFSIVLMIALSPFMVLIASLFYVAGIIYYFIRKKQLSKQGIDLEAICQEIPKEALEI